MFESLQNLYSYITRKPSLGVQPTTLAT